MSQVFNIYCDESCHLESDHQKAMVLGSVWCPNDNVRKISDDIRSIKVKHDYKNYIEFKWTKISPNRISFFLELIDYFFDNPNLHFRGLVIPDKSKINHKAFNQDHDTWYYKMYFNMIKTILDRQYCYEIYLDIKDTRSADRVAYLHKVLCNSQYDFDYRIIKRVQTIRSEESQLMQLADLFIGAISYVNRGLASSQAKNQIISKIREKTQLSLEKSTLYSERKFNLFVIQLMESFDIWEEA